MKSLVIGLLVAVSASPADLASALTLSENDGFCSGGAPLQEPFPTWGSYCDKGVGNVGHAATSTFRLTGPFDIYIAGTPNLQGLSLRLENLSDHQDLDIRPSVWTDIYWQRVEFEIPDSWRGKDLRIVAADRLTGWMGWVAFSAPLTPDKSKSRNDAKKILLKTLIFTLLIFLPGFTLSAFAISRGIRGTVKLGLVTLAGIAIPGYVLFFVYVLSAKAGYIVSLILPYSLGGLLLVLLFRLTPRDRQLLRPFLIPLALTFFASLGVLCLGYLYGGVSTPNMTAWSRFSHPLPPDNTIPYLFAEALQKGSMPKPLLGDWLSSDRPPLQTGIVLALEPWMRSPERHELWYEITSVIAQSLWIFAVWLLMRAFRISQATTALVIVTIYLSGFAIVNTFYVWPKLLAGAYIVAFAIPILAARPQAGRGSWLLRCLMAFLLVGSLLSHGGTLFALMGILLVMLFRYRTQMLKETCIVGALTVVLYSPWIGYQKFIDPPGDRLVKYHLAGVEQVTSEPALKTIYDAYRGLTFAQWLSVKKVNTAQAFGHEMEYWKEVLRFIDPQARVQIRRIEFFYVVPTLGFAGLGIAGLLLRWRKTRKSNELRAAERLLLWAFSMIFPWLLLMFLPLIMVVHAGPYALELAAMAGAILAFRAVAPRLAIAVCLMDCVFHWIVYEPDLTHAAFPRSLAESTDHWMMALHLASLCGFLAVLAVSGRPTRRFPVGFPSKQLKRFQIQRL